MKVAILSPQPRTSGVVTYSHHLKHGFRDLGHAADVLTFTLSGKPSSSFTMGPVDEKGVPRSGWGWTNLGFDRCERWSDAQAVLAEYDLIWLEEPRCPPMDKLKLKKLGDGDIKVGRDLVKDGAIEDKDLPPYIDALAYQGPDKKIIFTLHDPWYGPRHAPFLEYLLDYVAPDAAVTHRAGAIESIAWTGKTMKEIRVPHLPYRRAAIGPNERQRTIGATGRYINNKGQPTLVLAAALRKTPEDWEVKIGGASSLGGGPNHTFLTFEGLTKMGWKGHRENRIEADVLRGWPWQVSDEYFSISYVGPYENPVEFCRGLGVHVNATDPAFSGSGSVEYSTLEAMDAGCAIVLPQSAMPGVGAPEAFPFVVEKLTNSELTRITEERMATVENMSEAIWDAAVASDEGAVESMAEMNYRVLEEYHAPKRYVEKVLEGLE